jgi:hypothetical protein
LPSQGNADTKKLMRTIKEDLVWVRDWDSSFDFERAFKGWVEAYNTDFPHMALGLYDPGVICKQHSFKSGLIKRGHYGIKPRRRIPKGEAKVLFQPIAPNVCWSIDFISLFS